jgi:hypothetical protein
MFLSRKCYSFVSPDDFFNIMSNGYACFFLLQYRGVQVYRLLDNWEFKPKVPQRRFINTASSHTMAVAKVAIAQTSQNQ